MDQNENREAPEGTAGEPASESMPAHTGMDSMAKMWMVIAVLLFIVILVMTYLLFALPTPQTNNPVATTTPETPVVVTPEPVDEEPVNQPLSSRVIVSSPQPNTTVGRTFQVAGRAPGNWFFEADFPLQVRDKDGNVIARTFASAQGEWMTTELVGFTSTIHIDTVYTGEATLILLRNNPSGLPEHDDAVEVPIVIQ